MSKKEKEMVGDVPGTVLGMLADLVLKLKNGSITEEELERFTKKQNPFLIVSNLLTDWQNFYQDVFGITVDLSELQIPEKRKGFDRLIVIAKGMTAQQVFDKCKGHFQCWKYTDKNLDKIVPTNDRTTDKTYAIWLRNRVEADEELKNRSANRLKEQNIQGITLTERLLYELKYFIETKKHLDIQNLTLCSGSRVNDCSVPGVCWSPVYRKLEAGWYGSVSADGVLRSREVVS